ncbi:MAG: GDSL-type esterase/lipase family protein [Micrococcales bacterium]
MQQLESSLRVIVLGDQLITASGDPKGMGWVGRVQARTPQVDPTIELLTLPYPEDTSLTLSKRWQSEVQPRQNQLGTTRLAIALGNHDVRAGLSTSRSRLNLATVLDEALKYGFEPFVIGPTPHREQTLNKEIEQLSWGFEDVCARRNVPYVDCFHPLLGHEGWNNELQNSPSGFPGQVGYGLIAWLVLNRGWNAWLGIEEAE